MNFFESQTRARTRTGYLVFLFGLAVICIVLAIQGVAFALYLQMGLSVEKLPEHALKFGGLAVGTILLIAGGTLVKIIELRRGGASVATMMGAVPVPMDTRDPEERKLWNIIEEMSIASGCPLPSVFVLREEHTINAFAAGFSPTDAAICVTQGAIHRLTRDELQGVIAHEYSHIFNGDMRLNMKLMGVLHGILLIGLTGRLLLESLRHIRVSSSGSRSKDKNNGGGIILAILVLGLTFLVIGYIGVFFGSLIRAAVSRQREFLADAAAVQFTRNPGGLASALKKIGGMSARAEVGAAGAAEASHLFFAEPIRIGFFSGLASHPPLADRIRALDPSFDGTFPQVDGPLHPALAKWGASGLSDAEEATMRGAINSALAGASSPPPRPGRQRAVTVLKHETISNIGMITPESLRAAEGFLHDMPPQTRLQLTTPQGARTLALALLQGGTGGKPELPSFPPASRLPLALLTIPKLKALPPHEREAFLAEARAQTAADRVLSLYEFCGLRLFEKLLDPEASSNAARGPQYFGFNPLVPDASIIIGALAWCGTAAPEVAQASWEAGLHAMKATGARTPQFLPRVEYGTARLTEALDRLSAAAPAIKERVLRGAETAVRHDGQIALAEYELLRVVALTLDCPMPPLAEIG